MAANKIVSTIGHHGFWGCSAGFNFLDLLPFTDNENIEEPLNILLVSPGDIRHIMYTVARRRRSGMKTRPINFYILEQPLEILAREIMLLQILFDFELPVRQRANTFLEVFGNCLLQERTYKYVSDLALQLYSFIAKRTSSMSSANNTEDVESFLENIIDLSCMKYKEIDTLCSIYHDRYGSAKKHTTVGTVRASRLETKLGTPAAPTVETTTNAMVALRDQRLRGYYAERFDARTALTDWDYYHHLKPTVAGIIHIKLFREWRVNGIAFEFGDQVYTHSNYTLFTFVAGVMKKGLEKGNAKEILGYWGDVVCSPYYSFGIDDLHSTISKYEDGLFEIMNKDTGTEQHRHNSIEIAVYNVLAMLYEIETGMRYKLHRANDIFSGLGTVDNITGETDVKEISTPKAVEDTSSSDNAAKDAADENDEVLKEYLPPIAEESENVEVVHETKKPQFTAEEIEARRLKAEEASMVAMLRKAETIVESLDGIKVCCYVLFSVCLYCYSASITVMLLGRAWEHMLISNCSIIYKYV